MLLLLLLRFFSRINGNNMGRMGIISTATIFLGSKYRTILLIYCSSSSIEVIQVNRKSDGVPPPQKLASRIPASFCNSLSKQKGINWKVDRSSTTINPQYCPIHTFQENCCCGDYSHMAVQSNLTRSDCQSFMPAKNFYIPSYPYSVCHLLWMCSITTPFPIHHFALDDCG